MITKNNSLSIELSTQVTYLETPNTKIEYFSIEMRIIKYLLKDVYLLLVTQKNDSSINLKEVVNLQRIKLTNMNSIVFFFLRIIAATSLVSHQYWITSKSSIGRRS